MFRVFRFKKNEDGQAMVEFALVFLLVVMIAMAIAQFSMILSAQIAVTNAAREGARAASVGAKDNETVSFEIDNQEVTLDSVTTVVTNAIGGHPFLDTEDLEVSVSGDTFGNPVTVTVTGVVVKTIVPIPSFDNFKPGSANVVNANTNFNLSATSSMRLERYLSTSSD